MEIRMKSNRMFFIRFTGIVSILYGIIIIYMLYAHTNKIFDITLEPFWFLSSVLIFMFFIILSIVLRFHKGKSYVFSKEEIIIYDRSKVIKKIPVIKIRTMKYIPYRWFLLFKVGYMDSNIAGARRIYIREFNGTTHELGLFSERDAIKLQEKLYPDILEIMFDRRSN